MSYSLTYIGIIISVAGTFLVHAGFTEACSNEIVTNVPLLFGSLLAFIGRYRAGGVTLLGARK